VPVAIAFDWDHLLFEQYPVDPAVVEPHVPDGLALDTYGGDPPTPIPSGSTAGASRGL
jgi:uncharacterized protein YqjF (DUF2071 family)